MPQLDTVAYPRCSKSPDERRKDHLKKIPHQTSDNRPMQSIIPYDD